MRKMLAIFWRAMLAVLIALFTLAIMLFGFKYFVSTYNSVFGCSRSEIRALLSRHEFASDQKQNIEAVLQRNYYGKFGEFIVDKARIIQSLNAEKPDKDDQATVTVYQCHESILAIYPVSFSIVNGNWNGTPKVRVYQGFLHY